MNGSSSTAISDADAQFIQQFVMQRVGIVLTPEKRYLIETRLDPIARQMQLASITALVAKLRLRETMIERAVINAMTTNETLFFRDKQPFEVIRERILPKLVKSARMRGRIRIWCAACSSGQEPYSLSMIADEMARELAGIRMEIYATDISDKMIEAAKLGVYSQFEVQRGLPVKQLLKYFTQEGTRWRINPDLGRRIDFQAGNLLQPFRHTGPFDLILCRNVMIYFNEATKRDLLRRMTEVLYADGYLLLGGAETVLGLSDDLSPHESDRGFYVHRSSPEAYKTGFGRLRSAG